MSNSALFFSVAIIVLLVIQGFFAMMEMAAVSLNPVRLAFLLSKNQTSARILSKLLANPSRLFGTTLLGVNAAMQFGSECARRLYLSLSLPADYAPITQVLLVLFFAELCPMIAARRCSEHVIALGMPLFRVFVFIFRPFVIILSGISRVINRCLGFEGATSERYLSRDDIEQTISQQDSVSGFKEGEDPVISRLFSLKNMTAQHVLEPFSRFISIEKTASVAEVKKAMELESVPFVCLYDKQKNHIAGVVYTRDLVTKKNDDGVAGVSRSPWFIGTQTPLLSLISSFKTNKQSLGFVVDRKGRAIGVVTFDAIVDALFDIKDEWVSIIDYGKKEDRFIHRRFDVDMSIESIEKELEISLPTIHKKQSLEELMEFHLKRPLEKNDRVRAGRFKFSVIDDPALLVRTILIESM